MMRKEVYTRLRQYKGKRLLPGFQRQIAEALGYEVAPEDFLGLEETERLREGFFGRIKSEAGTDHSLWEPSRAAEVTPLQGIVAARLDDTVAIRAGDLWPTLEERASHVGGMRAILFHSLDEYLGALEVRADVALRRAGFVWTVIKYDFCLCSADLGSGLYLEYNHYDNRDVYELTTWGMFTPG